WRFIKVLKQEQGLTELKITQLGAGMLPHPTRINYRECADRLLAKTSSYAGIAFKRTREMQPISENLNLQELLGNMGCTLPPDFCMADIDAVVLPQLENTGHLYSTNHENSVNETLIINYLLGVAS
ncbi:unnamed protein product, partial [Allacma fusca]